MQHQQGSYYLPVNNYKLHITKLTPDEFSENKQKLPVLMLHGAIENSRIFYSKSGKGLGCYLADNGFSVYCADFAGRGLSLPHVSTGFNQSQYQMIAFDIPALIEHLYQKHQQKVVLICHSWGGVVACASLARDQRLADIIAIIVCFGTKRSISVKSLEKFFKINFLWNKLAVFLAKRLGSFPARKLKLGSDDEPAQFLQDTVAWIKGEPYIDLTDNFNYKAASEKLTWPPLWHFAAINDKILGHPNDVKAFIEETYPKARFTLLAKSQGFLQDYDHISMLTHPSCVNDHFVQLKDVLIELGVKQ